MFDDLVNNKLHLFMYTMKEYRRFSKGISSHELTDDFDEKSYVEVNTKLILLRKFGSKGQPVYIEEILKEIINKYPQESVTAENILKEYHDIINMQIEQVLTDGTKLNLYETIEDAMYGLYLHADANRIQRLMQTDERLRFICIRKYVEDFERVLFKTMDCIMQCGMEAVVIEKKHASVIALGNQTENQNVINSPFWSNVYGHDANDDELLQIYSQLNLEEMEILAKCKIFLEALKMETVPEELLDELIFPSSKKAWGDYSEAKRFYLKIQNPGISSKVRYNEQHTVAYVRIHPRVEDAFVVSTPHILRDIYEIALIKDYGVSEWKIYSFSGE